MSAFTAVSTEKRTACGARRVVMQMTAVGATAAAAKPAALQAPAPASHHRHCGIASAGAREQETITPSMFTPHASVRTLKMATQSSLSK